MAKLSPDIREAIKTMSFPELTKREENKLIIETIKERFNVVISSDDIYEIKTRTRKLREAIDELNEAVSEDKLYDVKDGNYEFVQDKLLYKIPVEEIDAMFYDFSKHGGNMSGEAMLAKYQLKPNVFHMIKNRLRLYKDSNVISPYTAENTSDDVLDEIVTEATVRHIDTIKSRMVKTHEKLYWEESKRAIRTLSNVEHFLWNVERYIANYKPKNIDFTPHTINPSYPPLTIAMSDFHFGKKGTADIVGRMSKIRDYVLSQPNTEIHIMSLGDLAEAFVEGGMHDWQPEEMEMHWFELMMYITNIFERFLEDIYKSGKKITFTWICGNHDRLWKSHWQDINRTGWLVVYELIKRGLSQSEIKINILKEKVNAFNYSNTRYIIHHGDDWFATKKPEDVLWKNGDNTKHNVILNWDRHNAQLRETKDATWVQVPALAWAGPYDKRLDLHSESGFIVIEENDYGTVDIILKRLP